MARQGENIYRRKDGRWEARISLGRKEGRTRFVSVYGRTKQEARAKKAAGKRKLARAKSPAQSVLAASRPTDFKTLGRNWLESIAPEVKESTASQYRSYWERYLLPTWGELKPADLTDAQVSEFLRQTLTVGGQKAQGLSPKTVREIAGILKRLRAFALQQGIAIGYSADCLTVKIRPKTPHILSEAETSALREKLQASQDRRDVGSILALTTGLRIGELCAIKGEDISLEEGVLNIKQTVQRIACEDNAAAKTKIICTAPKTASSARQIPLSKAICRLLSPYVQPGTYLLTGKADKCCEPRNLQYHFRKVLKSCGIEQASFHTLRHTFATRALEAGMDIKSLSCVLGHASVAITLNRYVHPSLKSIREQMAKVDGLLVA